MLAGACLVWLLSSLDLGLDLDLDSFTRSHIRIGALTDNLPYALLFFWTDDGNILSFQTIEIAMGLSFKNFQGKNFHVKQFLRKNFKHIVVWTMILLFLGTLVPSTFFMFMGN
jgi:hypothetical protein